MNFALERMSGEWFSWLSHDDLYYPEKIEKQIEFLNSLNKDDLSKTIVHCATESIDKNRRVIKRPSYKDIPEKENTLDTIIGNVYNYRLSGCSFLIPHTCYETVGGFREDIRTVSDVEYWYRLLFAGYQFYCMKNDILVQNRSHGKQVGKTKVSLFTQELDALHIAIADRLATEIPDVTLKDMEHYYLGLVKRGIKNAACHTKVTYLDKHMNALKRFVLLPAKIVCFRMLGCARTIVRDVYRKIFVK